METMPQFNKNNVETMSQKLGRLDAMISQVDARVQGLENGKDRKLKKEEIRALRYKKEDLLKERAELIKPEEIEMKKAS